MMQHTARLKEWVLSQKGKSWKTQGELADRAQINQSQVSRLLSGKTVNMETGMRILEALGGDWNFGPETIRPVTINTDMMNVARKASTHGKASRFGPDQDDYLAVPLAEKLVAAGPGLIPQDKIKSWVLVYRHHHSVQYRANLVAVEIGKNERSMVPTLQPGDIVLIDRNDKSPEPAGKIMLITEPYPDGPDGGAAIKRVAAKQKDRDVELTFYSDNAKEYPPSTCMLQKDYAGEISRAIAGRAVWSWSDLSEK